MLSALILLRHASSSTDPDPPRLTDAEARRAWALADFLQLYNPTVLLAAPGGTCSETLAPLADRLDLKIAACPDLAADRPKFPGRSGAAHLAAWLAARAVRVLPDQRRTAVICAESVVLAALLVAVAARDGHDLSRYDLTVPLEEPATLPPGGGWVLHCDDGRLVDVKPLAAR
ncbi:histidine phosphatase family protein [Glycomyces buryatensis]|uniref:Histidine phosphatase family protein n=1 Tax=Glycomyces buryatensis TaxID=2570927 RepID=A0A4S8Q6T4_9ACTN|nr:histidine phosphatase family protein [Glycomyces buryatensis]THV39840.1 histidine phosphatase family protein [Glycomyces buryatensis]